MSLEVPVANVSRSDLTIQFFDRIFGPEWESLAHMLSSSLGTQPDAVPSLIFRIAGIFNSIALIAMSLLWVWILAQSAVGTANDGKPMGSKLHTFWVPVRVAYAASLLTPVLKGLSLAQLIILSCVGFSVQCANMVWESGVDFLKENSGHVLLAAPPELQEQGRTLASGMLKSLTIRTWREERQGETFPAQWYTRSFEGGNTINFETAPWNEYAGHEEQNPVGQVVLRFTVPTASPEGNPGLSDGDFGMIKFSCPENNSGLCRDREEAIKEMAQSLMPLAERYAQDAVLSRAEQWSTLDSAVHIYTLRMASALRQQHNEKQAELADDITTFADSAKLRGWVMAGSYFWTISRLTERAADTLSDDTTYTPPNTRKYRGGMLPAFAGIDVSLDDLAAEQIEAAGAGSDINFLKRMFRSFSNNLVAMTTEFAAGHDVIASMASFGHYIIGTTEAIYIGIAGLAGSTAAVDGWFSSSVIGKGANFLTGGMAQGAASFAKNVIQFSVPGIWAMLAALFVAGFFFAYYIPALPYILWISGVVGWFVLVIEALVAAPLWVVVHSMPEGEGIAGQRAQQGYGLLLSILLRPALMVTGLLFSFVMVQGLGLIIGYTYMIFHASAHAETTMGIPHIIATLLIFVAVMYVTSHKMFGLISHLPDKVTGWINTNAPGMDSRHDEERTRAIFGAVGHKSENVVTSAAMGAVKGQGGAGAGGGAKENPADEADHLPGNMMEKDKSDRGI
jgi:conjugal transfer/type IV secretion protein DotA/TraY